jgi:hypothetical protein
MNCTKCNTPLATNTRFCPKCGQPASAAAANANAVPQYQQPAAADNAPTIPPTSLQMPQMHDAPTIADNYPPASWQGQPAPGAWQQAQPAPQAQPSYQQAGRPEPGTFSSAQEARPRRRGGCLAKSLITLVILLLLLAAGWFLALRPYLNNMAKSKLDSVLSTAVDSIPPPLALLPGGEHIPISENLVNNLLVLSSSPNDVMQNPQIHFTPTELRMDFQVFGLSCAVTGVPRVNSGRVTLTNVNIEGVAALILSPDDIMSIVNRHLADAQAKIKHSITSVQLKDRELDLVVGSGGLVPTGGGLPGGLPTSIPTGLPTGIPTLP